MDDARADRGAPEPAAPAEPPYWSGGHTKHRLRFHLVWVPKHKNASTAAGC